MPDRAGNHGEHRAVTAPGHKNGPRPRTQVRGRSYCSSRGGGGFEPTVTSLPRGWRLSSAQIGDPCLPERRLTCWAPPGLDFYSPSVPPAKPLAAAPPLREPPYRQRARESPMRAYFYGFCIAFVTNASRALSNSPCFWTQSADRTPLFLSSWDGSSTRDLSLSTAV